MITYLQPHLYPSRTLPRYVHIGEQPTGQIPHPKPHTRNQTLVSSPTRVLVQGESGMMRREV